MELQIKGKEGGSFMEMIEGYIWAKPKTNWTKEDRFNIGDYNRIKNNLAYLHKLVEKLYREFEIRDMGPDINDYAAYWPVEVFNAWEKNLEEINKQAFSGDYGDSQTFFSNGPFIKFDELNRIESASVSLYENMKNQFYGRRKLMFMLGVGRRF